MKEKWYWVVLTCLLWFIVVGLAALLFFTTRNSYLILMALSDMGKNTWRILDKLLVIVAAIGFLIVVGLSEYSLRHGLQKKTLLRTFMRYAGIEVLLILTGHLLYLGVSGFSGISGLSIVLLVIESFFGLGFLSVSLVPKWAIRLPL